MDSSAAQAYFDQIIGASDPAESLASLAGATSPTFETEWLDFKGNPRPEHVQRIWSKALSAFANTEGGVLIWGIDARKDSSGIDCAGSLSLVSDPTLLKSQLLESQHQATDPPVSGVKIEQYECTPKAPSGFVVCLIPESQVKPIRADRVENKPYYIRAGTSSVIPSPSLLRSLFYPQSKSKLVLSMVPIERFGQAPAFDVRFEVTIRNDGPATARDVRIVVRREHQVKFEKALGWAAHGHPNGVAFNYAFPLHPGDSSIAIGVTQQVQTGQTPFAGGLLPVLHSELTLWFTAFSSDHEAQHFAVRFNGLEMGQGTEKKAQPMLAWPE